MWCYNCRQEVSTHTDYVGRKQHNFCNKCNCNLILQHKFVDDTRKAVEAVKANVL